MQYSTGIYFYDLHRSSKNLCTFWNTKHNGHRFALNLQQLKIMIVEGFSQNITCWGAVVFQKLVKQCHKYLFYMLK